jgi:hypothetical protein
LGEEWTYIFSSGNVYGSGRIIDIEKYGKAKNVKKFEKIM